MTIYRVTIDTPLGQYVGFYSSKVKAQRRISDYFRDEGDDVNDASIDKLSITPTMQGVLSFLTIYCVPDMRLD